MAAKTLKKEQQPAFRWEKKQKISVSIDHLYTKSNKELTGDFLLCAAAMLA